MKSAEVDLVVALVFPQKGVHPQRSRPGFNDVSRAANKDLGIASSIQIEGASPNVCVEMTRQRHRCLPEIRRAAELANEGVAATAVKGDIGAGKGEETAAQGISEFQTAKSHCVVDIDYPVRSDVIAEASDVTCAVGHHVVHPVRRIGPVTVAVEVPSSRCDLAVTPYWQAGDKHQSRHHDGKTLSVAAKGG